MKRIGGVINRVVLDVLDVEFIPRVEHLLSKNEKFYPKSKITLIFVTYVFIEQIESNSAWESI